MSAALVLALGALALPLGGAQASDVPMRSYAVIVANNQSLDPAVPSLRFADDDGVRYAELFRLEGARVRLFTVLDDDSQRLYPEEVARARPPRRAELLQGLADTFAEIRQDTAAGYRTQLYFVFSGHGETREDGEGYVHLLDGPLTRDDLFKEVIAASPATLNHIVIDACNAYFMVAERGSQAKPAGNYDKLIRTFVSRARLASYPNTGVLLSTASAAEVHEWGRIEAGIFSHELRSALAGAADANADGAIDYDEAAAYLAAANGALPDRRTRLDVFAKPPAQDSRTPLLVIPTGGARLRVPSDLAGRYSIEDDRGVRYADFNNSSETSLNLSLVPRPIYYVRRGDEEYRLAPATDGERYDLEAIAPVPARIAMRGSASDAFDRYLFAVPFGPQFVAGFKQARLGALTPPTVTAELDTASTLRAWRYGATATSATLAVATAVLETMARSAAADYRNAAGAEGEIELYRSRAESLHRLALFGGGLSLGAGIAAAGLYWLEF